MAEYLTKHAKDWTAFQEILGGFRGWAFRGQEDETWPLDSSIARILRNSAVNTKIWSLQEDRINRIFRRKAHLFLTHIPPEDDDFQWLALMQHHGAPTRLLDFTWSPYVAAFFALEKARGPAAVWAMCAPKMWGQQHVHPETGETTPTSELFLRTPGNYRRWYLNGTLPFVVLGEPVVMNQRLVAQAGTFVVPGVIDRPVDTIIGAYAHPERLLAKIIIDTKPARDEFMTSLYMMNITNASLFPGLDGMAHSLAYELEYHWQYNTRTLAINPGFLEDPNSPGVLDVDE